MLAIGDRTGFPTDVDPRLSRQPLRSAGKCAARVVGATDFRKTMLEVAVTLTPEDEAELRFAVIGERRAREKAALGSRAD